MIKPVHQISNFKIAFLLLGISLLIGSNGYTQIDSNLINVNWEYRGSHASSTYGLGSQPAGFDTATFPHTYQNRLGCTTFGDLDNDGDQDFISGTQEGIFYYYENVGTSTSPQFGRTALATLDSIHLGNGQTINQVRPELVDIDNDGDLDLFAGSRYAYDGSLGFKLDDIYFFENIGTATNPIFTHNRAKFPSLQYQQVAEFTNIAAVDIDGDTDLDLVMMGSDSVGYFENIGTLTNPSFQRHYGANNYFDQLSFSKMLISIPDFEDFDGDGDFDMYFGDDDGTFKYFQNTGTATVPVFHDTNLYPLHGMDTVDIGQFCHLEFVDITNDGTKDLVATPFQPMYFMWWQGVTQGVSLTIASTNISCNGLADGTAKATVSGATGPVAYAWSTTATTDSIGGLMAGTYIVTITDSIGGTAIDSVVIIEPTSLVASTVVDASISCNGLSDGGSTASATGGTAPYTYSWSNTATTASIAGVIAGTYSTTITDQNGCTDSTSVVITEPLVLVASTTVDSNDTGAGTGGATGSATGGSIPYAYLWSNGATTSSITSLAAGTYTTTITDNNGCANSASVFIATGPSLSITIDSNISCNGLANGGATAVGSSGTLPYTYSWSNSATTASITGVIAGTYTVTLTDANSISAIDSVTITEPIILVSSGSVTTPISQQGLSDGAIMVSDTGGTSPYTHLWSNGGTTASITNLGSGTYTVTTTDQNGCTDTAAVFLVDPLALSATTINITATNTGSIDLTALGGTTPYSYLWNTGNVTQDLMNITAGGIYSVTVTDSNNDTISTSVEILNTLDFFVTTWKTDNPGNSNSTSITIPTNSNLTYNYDIDWNNDGVFDTLGITGDITHDYGAAGSYTVNIKGDYPHLMFPFRNADNDKIISVDQWGSQQWESMKQTFVRCDSFQIIATDTPNLSLVTDMSRMFNNASNFNQDISHWDVSNVTNMIGVFQGAESFNQPLNNWDVSSVTNMENLFNNAPVFNQSLSSWQTDSVNQMSGMFNNATAFNQDISSWEVGNVTEMEDMFSGAESFNQPLNTWDVSKVEEMHAIFRDAIVFNQDLNNWDVSLCEETSAAFDGATTFNGDITTWNVSNVEYMQEMFEGAAAFNQDISGWDVSSVKSMSYMFNGAGLFDQNLGNWDVSLTTSFSGFLRDGHLSTANYDSLLIGWSALTLSSGESPNFGSSNYCMGDIARQNIITNFGWSISDSGQLCSPVINFIQNDITCFGNANGSLTANITPGVPPYTYAWSTGSTDSNIVNLVPGTYTVTVTDSLGFADTASATITQPTILVSVAVVDSNVSCSGTPNGGASVAVSGGTSPYTYLWSSATTDTTASISGVIENSYYVTSTDSNGCSNLDTVMVVVEDTILPIVVTQNINAYLDNTGTVSIVATDVDNGSTDACGIQTSTLSQSTFNCTDAGSNSVYLIVTDVNGNTDSATATIMIMDTLNPIISVQNHTAYLDANGVATIDSTNVDNGSIDNCSIQTIALSNSSFTCANVGTNPVLVTVTDVNGNSDTATVTVTVSDTTSPMVITQNLTVYLDANGSASITTADIDNGSTDNCSISTLSLDSTQFDCSETGYNTVTLTATDVNANTSTSTATVTVLDTISPIVITQNHTAYLNPSGFAMITANDIDNGSTDNCSIQSLTLNQVIFNCADTGANTVTLQVTDLNGNISSANATVTIMDTLMPTVVTQNVNAYLDASGSVSIVVADIDNGSFDNCSIDTMVLDMTTFDCSNVSANTVTLTVTDVNGNSNTATAVVTVMDTINPMVATQDITVYLDATGLATITDTDIDNGSTDNCAIQSFSLDISIFNCNDLGVNTVILAATDANGNVSSASAVVTVLDTITPVITCPAAFSDCGPEITIPDVITTDNCLTTLTLVSGIESNQTFPVGLTTNTYLVEDISGNSATCSVDVTRFPQPVVAVREDTTVYYEQSVKLYSSSEFVVEWEWTPRMFLNDASSNQPVCTPQHSSDYTLVGKSADGCYSEPKTVAVTMNEAGAVLVPNTFSPNGDGYNDYFEIPGISFHPDMRMTIFNRNGEILFQETGYENNWDGTANGKILPVATYYFILDQGNGKEPIKGDITIIK